MEHRLRPLTACFVVSVASCAHPAPATSSPPTWKTPTCVTHPLGSGGALTGATITCEGASAVSYDELREAAIFDSAKATLAARRTHFVVSSEERRQGAPATQCPNPGRDEPLRLQMERMTGGTIQTGSSPQPCKPIPGSEGRVLVLTVRFLRTADAATVPGARSAAEGLGMSTAAPPSTARSEVDARPRPEVDASSDGAAPLEP
jgi:hypothetical protein